MEGECVDERVKSWDTWGPWQHCPEEDPGFAVGPFRNRKRKCKAVLADGVTQVPVDESECDEDENGLKDVENGEECSFFDCFDATGDTLGLTAMGEILES